MPLIILGIIVVVGGLILALSHFKPKIGRRLRGGYSGFGFGGFDGLGALQDENNAFKMPFDEGLNPTQNAEGGVEGQGDSTFSDHDDNGKVLFIFGNGEREERPSGDDGDQNK